jgi:protein O-GlcNAc transferase
MGESLQPSSSDPQMTEQLLREALERDPGQVGLWNELGTQLEGGGNLSEALQAHLQAAERDPLDVVSRSALGHLFRRMSFPEEAIYWHGEALALEPRDLVLQLNHTFVLPVIARSNDQILQLRERSIAGLESLLKTHEELAIGPRSYSMIHHPQLMLYHNCDNRSVLENYGSLLQRHLPWGSHLNGWTGPAGRRFRIGFISAYFSSHSNTLAFEGLIRHLDRNTFELTVIHLDTSICDQVRQGIDACADQTIILSGSLSEARQRLSSLQLDLLFFTDIGMHPFFTLLACSRIAPVQATGWGVPQTSGMPCLDYYVSSELLEPGSGQLHYSESLVQLPGLPACYRSENLPNISRGRDYYFLPSDVPLLGCLQSFWKLHPDFDPILEKIAQRIPDALFVFIEADITAHTQTFLDRISQSAPSFRQKLLLLSHMSRSDYIALAAVMDLLLDPPHFSSGVTLYETLHTGTPTVAMEGAFLRSRFAAGAYRLIGLQNAPVASNPQAYVDRVVDLLEDREQLSTMRSQIADLARRHLYDRLDVVRGFETFAVEAIERAAMA